MSTIIFKVLGTPSHYNATYKLAQELQMKGHRIIYIGEQSFQETIMRQGFEFYNNPIFPITEKAPRGNIIKQIIHRFRINKKYQAYYLKGDLFDEVIEKFKPDLFILDVSLGFLFPVLLEKQIKFIVFSTKVSLNKAYLVPPFTSSFIPDNNIWSLIRVEWLWQNRFIKNKLLNFYKRLKFFGVTNFELAKKYLRRNNLSPKDIIDTSRVSHFGIRIAPEIILSLQEFDFPRKIESNQLYMCPCVNLSRNELPRGLAFSGILAKSDIREGYDKIVYCSFGSYDSKYRSTRIIFLMQLIKLFMRKKNYALIISTNKDVNPAWFNFKAHNVYLYQSVPQLEILSNCDLMINQGGMQSVQECVLKTVPMLVYPLNPDLDQEGNAARVLYHGLGLRGNIDKDTEEEIEEKMERIFNDRSFKYNITQFQKKCIANDSFDTGINFIDAYIKSSGNFR